jgi:phosphinothricin acetyltransferase
MTLVIRCASEADGEAIAAIYRPAVLDTVISFEMQAPDGAAMAARVAATLPRWPWLVSERDGRVTGYAYAGRHRDRDAYQWCVEVSVYIAADARRAGTARALYGTLFELLRAQGYVNAYAGITLPNAASVGLHESLGFTPAGVTRRVGFKLGRWHDVGTWELALRPPSLPLEPPSPLARVLGSQEWQRALANGASRFLAPERSRGDGKEEEDPDDEAPSVE